MEHAKQQEIFERWLQDYRGLMFKFVRAYAFNQADQEDLFQELALQIWRSIPSFLGKAAESTWVYRVTMNTAIAWSRKEKKHRQGKESLQGVEQILGENQQADERLTWLYEQIAKLNEIDRAICLLMLDGFSYKEMAKILGISESNVGVKINRIKKGLVKQSKSLEQHEL